MKNCYCIKCRGKIIPYHHQFYERFVMSNVSLSVIAGLMLMAGALPLVVCAITFELCPLTHGWVTIGTIGAFLSLFPLGYIGFEGTERMWDDYATLAVVFWIGAGVSILTSFFWTGSVLEQVNKKNNGMS